MTIGVLALQGDVREHAAALAALGVDRCAWCGSPTDLDGLSGLVLPGGESTTLSLAAGVLGAVRPARRRAGRRASRVRHLRRDDPVGHEVLDGRADQRGFGAIDLAIRRNGYGRQAARSRAIWRCAGLAKTRSTAVFIRAPLVERAGPEVQVLATVAGRPPAVRPPVRPSGSGSRRPRPVVCRQGVVLTPRSTPS